MQLSDTISQAVRTQTRAWLVTGAAGFIGSNLVETLLRLGQKVTGFDNFSTGKPTNLESVKQVVDAKCWGQFQFVKGDIRDLNDCRRVCQGMDIVLHQAALGSVPRSLEDPITTNDVNISGFVNMLVGARDAGVKRFVYAASSSTYGDHPGLPKIEETIGRPLSPYAVTKYVNELYADVFKRAYGIDCIGLRYFNVFGPRQDPDGAYAAVIPRWVAAMINGRPVEIFGDGETSRDFCYVANTVQANLLAATSEQSNALNQVYNVAVGDRTTLNELYFKLRDLLSPIYPALKSAEPVYRAFREGDVRHSQADVTKARKRLGYEPTHTMAEGLAEAIPYYVRLFT